MLFVKSNSLMRTLSRKAVLIVTVIAALSFSSLIFVPAAVAVTETFVVNSTADLSDADPGDGVCETENEGECTLRAAIEEANNYLNDDGSDTAIINFNIPGDGVRRIEFSEGSLGIGIPVVIDGFSQPGAQPNTAVAPLPLNGTILIEVVPAEFHEDTSGFYLSGKAQGSVIKGLSILNFDQAIKGDADDVELYGNYINVDSSGLMNTHNPNSHSIYFPNRTGMIIGSSNPQDRNVIGGGTVIDSASEWGNDVTMYGNYYGIGADGVTDLGVFHAAHFTGASIIGGPGPGQTNLFAGATVGQAQFVDGYGGVIQGNLIGTDYTGEVNENITNGPGILVSAQSGNVLIGGTEPGEGNIIRGVSGMGITVIGVDVPAFEMSMYPTNVAILGNIISDIGIFEYLGFGNSNLAIDLNIAGFHGAPTQAGPDYWTHEGPNSNDVGDVDDGPNGYLNTPILKTAQQIGDELTVTFDLDVAGAPEDEYRVEFFANDISTIFGHGPAQTFLGAVTVSSGTNKTAVIDLGSSASLYGKALSSTTTIINDSTPSGFGSTSELSQNIQIGSETDFDADGISDAVENLAVNSGDGNNDSIPDRLQPTVSSYTIGGIPVTFVTDGCSANGSVSSLSASSINKTDTGFAYPYGLTDFTLNCSRGDTVTVIKYVYDDNNNDLADYHVRKYLPDTDSYIEVEDATVERQNINGNTALVMSYSLTDGGQYDDDGEENGVIVDPVGLARVATSSSNTDDTGQSGNNSSNNNGSAAADNVNSARGLLSTTGARYAMVLIAIAAGLIVFGATLYVTSRKRRSNHNM